MTDPGPTVYVVQRPFKDLDISSAEDFGALVTCLDEREQVGWNGREATLELGFRLQNYRDQDFLLAIGDPVAIAIAGALAAQANGGRFTILKWDRRKSKYFPTKVDLSVVKRRSK